jgi:hypothetical protein
MFLVIIILIMALILVILVLKPELGMQLKAFSEKMTFDAEWKPQRSTRYRFVFIGLFIELVFLGLLLYYWIFKT